MSSHSTQANPSPSSMLSKRANELYLTGQFEEALILYERLNKLFDGSLFQANIRSCRQHLLGGRAIVSPRKSIKNLRVACILDEFSYTCFSPECSLLQLNPTNAISELSEFNPDILFVESAWRGKDDLWRNKIATNGEEINSILIWCRSHNVPTAFWNKEDPVHFSSFLTIAQEFDFVFTTDFDCLARYKAVLKSDRVFLLPFACQPKIHNPIEHRPRRDGICFAGAYYSKYPDRSRDLAEFIHRLPRFKPLEIFDRNHGKDNPLYQFPDTYKPFIVGCLPPDRIDEAYKGYNYAVNLNSVKQSQTMMARRVFELLASNTTIISNYSRAIRLLFGDLVISSDDGEYILRMLTNTSSCYQKKLALAGLRKVLLEHTYTNRLYYVASKAIPDVEMTPHIAIVAIGIASSKEDADSIIHSFIKQTHRQKHLLLICSFKDAEAINPYLSQEDCITIISSLPEMAEQVQGLSSVNTWIAKINPHDFYGKNYLLDLALATIYTDEKIIGKCSHYELSEGMPKLVNPGLSYRICKNAFSSAYMFDSSLIQSNNNLFADGRILQSDPIRFDSILSIDYFNYCRNCNDKNYSDSISEEIEDATINSGITLSELIKRSDLEKPAERAQVAKSSWCAKRISSLISSSFPEISIDNHNTTMNISSSLGTGKHQYLYSKSIIKIDDLPSREKFETFLEITPGLDIQYVFLFLDSQKQKIGSAILGANQNQSTQVDIHTAYIRFGLRIAGSGNSEIKTLDWNHRDLSASSILGRGDYLVITNHYPSYDDLYRNGFLHSRVSAYQSAGCSMDVFRLRADQAVTFDEFNNVDVITGSQEALHSLIKNSNYKGLLIHFLDPLIWDVVRHYIDNVKITVWVHGAEIQPLHRREYNYTSGEDLEKAQSMSDARMKFWRGLLKSIHKNLRLVFVSQYFADEVMEDIGFHLPVDAFTVIHNPIDTELFSFIPKDPAQRKKILSIRPYASRKYANDLSVAAILEISKEPWFSELEITMIGDGSLFDATLEPLRSFSNINLERRFLTQHEIAQLHKEYGLFLSPTRMDAQGVSRDEAMSSGLVPLTNNVAAIPEFTDANCAILAPADDYKNLALGISSLYKDPDLFVEMSTNAALRVRSQSSAKLIIQKELDFITQN